MDAPTDDQPKKPFLREWWQLIALAIVLPSLVIGVRLRSEYLAEQPIEAVYANYLDALAKQSVGANAILERYYRAYKRDTVASQSFISICKAMQTAALQDGVDTKKIRGHFTEACSTSAAVDELMNSLPQVDGATGKTTYPSEKK
ncbi:MAG: hypothetical protein ACK5OQ_15485 [Burkholderiales bacterium]|jgi:hypothetical protein